MKIKCNTVNIVHTDTHVEVEIGGVTNEIRKSILKQIVDVEGLNNVHRDIMNMIDEGYCNDDEV